MNLIINSRYNYTKPDILYNSIEHNYCKISCNKCVKNICCCTKVNLFVEKTLLSIYKVKSKFIPEYYRKFVMSYEITLINESCLKITNIGIQDTLFNLMSSFQVTIGLRIVSCSDNLVIRSLDDIYNEEFPQLLDINNSYIPPCSVSKLIVTIIFTSTSFAIKIKQLMNTITITGCIENKQYCSHIKCYKIEPIIKKSILWSEENGMVLTHG